MPVSLWIPQVSGQGGAPPGVSSLVAGSTATYTFIFNTGGGLFGGSSSVQITFPDAGGMPYGFSSATAQLQGTPVTGSSQPRTETYTPSVSGLVVTVTRTSGPTGEAWSGAVTVRLFNVVNPLWAGTTGTFSLQPRFVDNAAPPPTTYSSIDFSRAALQAASVSTALPAVAQTSNHIFSFAPTTEFPQGTKFLITFPRDYEFAAPPTLVDWTGFCGQPNLANLNTNPPSVSLTQPANCAKPSEIRVVLGQITNPKRSTPTGSFVFDLITSASAPFATASVVGIRLQPTNDYFVSSAVSYQPADPKAGATSAHTIRFSGVQSWPTDGYLALYFPRTTAGKNVFQSFSIPDDEILTGATMLAGTGCAGGAFQSPSVLTDNDNSTRRFITLRRTPAQGTCTDGTYAITLNSIVNPGRPDVYSSLDTSYNVAIQNGANVDLQATFTPAPIEIQPGLTGLTISWGNTLRVLAPDVPVLFSFTTANDWPKDGTATIEFPDDFGVGAIDETINSGASGGITACLGDLQTTIAGRTVRLSRITDTGPTPDVEPSTCVSGQHRFQTTDASPPNGATTGITLPAKAGRTKPITLSFFDGSGAIIERSAATIPTTIVRPLLDQALTAPATFIVPASAAAGAITSYTFSLGGLGAAGSGWSANDLFAIGFPAGYDVSGVGQSVRVTGPCTSSSGLDLSIQQVVGTTILLRRPTGAASCENPATHTFVVNGVRNPAALGFTEAFYFATRNAAGTDLRALGNGYGSGLQANPTIQIIAAALPGASFSLSNRIAAANSQLTASFNTPVAIPPSSTLDLRLPDGFVITNPQLVGSFSGCDGSLTPTVLGQVVTLTRTGATHTTCASGAKSVTISGIKNPATVGDTGAFGLTITGPSGLIATNQSIHPVRIVPTLGSLSSPSITLPTGQAIAAAQAVTYTFAFGSAGGLPTNAKIRIEFPTDIDITASSMGATSFPGGCGTPQFLRGINTVTITNTGTACAAGSYSFGIANINNPPAKGSYGPVRLVIQSATGTDAEEAAPQQLEIAAGPLNNLAITADTPLSLAESIYRFQFDSVNPWPSTGRIQIRFPSGYDLAEATPQPMSGCTSGFTSTVVEDDEQTVRLVRDGGGGACGPGLVVVKLAQIVNPASTTPKTFDIELQTATGAVLSAAYGVLGPALQPVGGQLSDLTIEAADLRAGALTSYWANFTTVSEWPAAGKIVLGFPAGYSLTGAQFGSFTGCTGSFTRTVNAAEGSITISRSGATTDCLAGAKSLRLTNIKNPVVAGDTDAFSLMVRDASGGDLDVNHEQVVEIAPGRLSVSSVSASPSTAGDFSDYTIAFSPSNPWPGDGKLSILFPEGYNVGGVASTRLTIGGVTSELARATGVVDGRPALNITRSGGPTAFASASILVKNVRNPTATGPTEPLEIQTQNAATQIIDSDASRAVQILPKGFVLLPPEVEASETMAGQTATYTITFTPRSQIPAAGCLRVLFPSSFDADPSHITATVTRAGSPFDVDIIPSLPGITLARPPGQATVEPAEIVITIMGVVNPTFADDDAGPINALTLQSLSTSPDCQGADLDGAYGGTIAIQPQSLTATVTSISHDQVGALADYTFDLTAGPAWALGDTLRITLPEDYGLEDVQPTVTSTDPGAGTLTATVDDNVIEIARDDASPWNFATKTFRVLGITNPKSGNVPFEFVVEQVDEEGRLRALDPSVAAPALAELGGALSGLDLAVGSDVVGIKTDFTFTLTTIEPWPEDAGLRLRFPAAFDVSEVVSTVVVQPASVGTLTAQHDAGSVVLLSRDGPSLPGPSTFTFAIDGVRNPGLSGPPGPIYLATLTADGLDLDTGILQAVTIEGGSVMGGISASSHLAGALSTYTFTLGVADPWPGDGKMRFLFPAGYDLSQAAVKTFTGCSDTFGAPDIGGLEITLTRNGATTCAPGTKIVALEKVRNPGWSGNPGTFLVSVLGPNDALVGATAATQGPIIQPFYGSLALPKFEPANAASQIAGAASASYQVEFKTATTIPQNGYLSIRLPPGYDVSGATIAANALGSCASLTPVPGGPNEILRRLSANCNGPSSLYSFVVAGIKNPGTAGLIGPIHIATQSTARADLEASAMTVELDPSVLSLSTPQRVAGSPVAGETATYALPFTTTNSIPIDGFIVVDVPDGFGLEFADAPLLQGCDVPIGGFEVDVDLVIVRLEGTSDHDPCPGAAAKTLWLSGLQNPGRSGTTDPWTMQTRDADGQLIDQSGPTAGPLISMRGAGLTDVSIDADYPLVGGTTDLLLSFTTSTPWAQAGRLQIGAPTGFFWTEPTAAFEEDDTCTGDLTAQHEGTLLTLTRSGADAACDAGPHAVLVSGLVNRPTAGVSPPFHIATQTPEGFDVDASDVATLTLVPMMSTALITPADPTAGKTTNYQVQFHSMVDWPQDGLLILGLPKGTGVGAAATTSAPCTGASAAVLVTETLEAAPRVVVKLLGATCPAGLRTVTLTGMTNALSSGDHVANLALTGPFSGDEPEFLAGSEEAELELVAATLQTPVLAISPAAAGQVGEYTFSYTASVPLPAGAKVRALVPSAYGISGAIAARNAAGSSPQFSVTKTSGQVTAALVGTTSWPSGAREFVLAGITNPSAGTAPAITLQYLNADGVVYAVGTFAGPVIGATGDVTPPGLPGPLASTGSLKLAPAWSKGLTHSVTWTAAADAGGLRGYAFAIDQDPGTVVNTTTNSATIVFPGPGAHALHMRAIDVAGNLGGVQTYTVRIDDTVPVLGALTADEGVLTCTDQPTATLSWPAASDTVSGLHPTQTYRVTVGGIVGNWLTSTTAAVTLAKGINNVSVTAQDAAGNTAAPRFINLKRDADAPNATLTAPRYARGPFEIRWNGTDDCAGIKDYRVEMRAGPNAVFSAIYEGPLNRTVVAAPTADAELAFRIRATDHAGRIGSITARAPVVTVFDATAPPSPTNLQAVPLAGGVIKLTWLNVTDVGGAGLDGYHVYRAEGLGAPFDRLTTAPVRGLLFNDVQPKTSGTAYYYQVAAVDEAGNHGAHSLTASAPADNRDIIGASTTALSRLAEAFDMDLGGRQFKAIDLDGDGLYDAFEDSKSTIVLEETTAVNEEQAFLLRSKSSDARALWMPLTDMVLPVDPTPGAIVSQETTANESVVTVKVEKLSGWILINVSDARPGQDIIRVDAYDGRTIPLARVFRDAGTIRFLDDPEVTYDVVYDATSGPLDTEADQRLPAWMFYAAGGGALIVVLLITLLLVLRGRRRRGQAAAAVPPQPEATPEAEASLGPEDATWAADEQAVPEPAPVLALDDTLSEVMPTPPPPVRAPAPTPVKPPARPGSAPPSRAPVSQPRRSPAPVPAPVRSRPVQPRPRSGPRPPA